MIQHTKNGRDQRDSKSERKSSGGLSAMAAVRRAKAQMLELTGREAESVSSVSRTRGGWVVALEIVELERIPQSTDILASYQVELDESGELVSYDRVARYYRNQASDQE